MNVSHNTQCMFLNFAFTKMAKEGKNIAANIGMKCISSVRAHWCRNSGKKKQFGLTFVVEVGDEGNLCF